MKSSIRKKVAFTFILLMAAVLAAIGVFEFFFIERFYLQNKERILQESWTQICDVLGSGEGETGRVSDSFLRFCSVNGLTYCVADAELTVTATNADSDSQMAGRLFGNILGMEEKNSVVIRENAQYRLIRIRDRFSDMEYLELWGRPSEDTYYIVLTPLQSIADAAGISFRFYLYIGIAAVVIGAFLVWMATRNLVRPLQELTELTGKMTRLDFNARYTSGGEDEIGVLGENFNTMSDALQKTVSELKSANAALEKDIEEKTQIDEMRKEFLSNVSHELKTPIALIQGYAEGLRDNISDDEESREFYCDVIIDESNKMNRMVRQLMTLNQLEFGNERLEMVRFDLAELIRGVIASQKLMIEQKGAQVLFHPDGPVYVWGDDFKIEEVVTNYLTNALNHLEGEKIIDIRCEEKDGIVETTVFNTGKPIPADSLDRIWDKFYKVDKARTRAYGGSGIGLSIVKAILDAHGQRCFVTNYDNGVAFSFTLESKAL